MFFGAVCSVHASLKHKTNLFIHTGSFLTTKSKIFLPNSDASVVAFSFCLLKSLTSVCSVIEQMDARCFSTNRRESGREAELVPDWQKPEIYLAAAPEASVTDGCDFQRTISNGSDADFGSEAEPGPVSVWNVCNEWQQRDASNILKKRSESYLYDFFKQIGETTA